MPRETLHNSPNRQELPHQLDDDIAQSIRDHLDEQTQDKPPREKAKHQVTPDMCALMHYMYDKVDSKKEVCRRIDGVCYTTVRKHLTGRCSCEERKYVHYDDCMRMRNRAHKGAPTKTLAVLHDLTVRTVQKHVYGRCDHEDGYAPLTTPGWAEDIAEKNAD